MNSDLGSQELSLVANRGGKGGSINPTERFPVGMAVFRKGQGRSGKYEEWHEREGIIVPAIENPVLYLTPKLVEKLEIDGRVLLGNWADGKFGVCNTHKSDRNGYVVSESTENGCQQVAASRFIKRQRLKGEEYYFYPVRDYTDRNVAIFYPDDREVMDV